MNSFRLPCPALLLAAGLMVSACGPARRHGGWDFDRMRRQSRDDPYEASDFFADGKTMQSPPEGTVPWIGLDAPADPSPGAGKDRYDIYCRVCHGAAGFGGTELAANSVPSRAFSLRSGSMRARSAAYIEQVITRGIGRMPALDWQLSPAQRRAVARYVVGLLAAPATDSAGQADSLKAARQGAIDDEWERRRALQAARP